MISEEAKNKIKEFEGLRTHAYRCSAGVWTCGYGHTRGVTRDTRCSTALADQWLTEDLTEAEKCIKAVIFKVGSLKQGQKDALASFVFNVGSRNFIDSTLYKTIVSNPNSKAVGEQFKRWCHVGNVQVPGLIRRRQWEVQKWYEA